MYVHICFLTCNVSHFQQQVSTPWLPTQVVMLACFAQAALPVKRFVLLQLFSHAHNNKGDIILAENKRSKRSMLHNSSNTITAFQEVLGSVSTVL